MDCNSTICLFLFFKYHRHYWEETATLLLSVGAMGSLYSCYKDPVQPDINTMIPLLYDSINTVTIYILLNPPNMNCHASRRLWCACNGVLKHHDADKKKVIHCMISYEIMYQIVTSAWTSCYTYDSVIGTSTDHCQTLHYPP